MKLKQAFSIFILLASSLNAFAGTIVYKGNLGLPYYRTTFAYNAEKSKAWIAIEAGEEVGVDGGSLWNNVIKELPVAGLTYNSSTNEIVFNGIACGRARLHSVLNGADYPFKDYKTCLFTASTSESENYRGDVITETTISLETSN
jgi:hypothetical protein